jgi:cytochrome c-type biogenesis protein CcmE
MDTTKLTKIIIAVAVIGIASAYLLHQTFRSSWAYYYSVDDFVRVTSVPMQQGDEKKASRIDPDRIIRLAGKVKEGSVVNNVEKMELNFDLAGQKSSLLIKFRGAVPRNFAAGKEVVVEGMVAGDGSFQAAKILTRCESKYRARLDPNLMSQ